MKKIYNTEGTCSKQIIIDVDETSGVINSVEFTGGCPGNTLGVSRLVQGRTISDVIELCRGIDCRSRGTSCPDQLAQALSELRV